MMDTKQFNKLKQFYYSVKNQQQLFYSIGGRVNKQSINALEQELNTIKQEFPDLLPHFRKQDYLVYDILGDYDINGIRSYLGIAVGRLQAAIELPSIEPKIEMRDFSFINNEKLRKVLERDYSEIQRVNSAECWKSLIILCGGAIEAILTDLLLINESKAKGSSKASKNPDITRWDLSDLISVSVDLGLVSLAVGKLSHPLREYRNLVHPGNEIRNKLTFDAEEARIALEVLNIVHRDLST